MYDEKSSRTKDGTLSRLNRPWASLFPYLVGITMFLIGIALGQEIREESPKPSTRLSAQRMYIPVPQKWRNLVPLKPFYMATPSVPICLLTSQPIMPFQMGQGVFLGIDLKESLVTEDILKVAMGKNPPKMIPAHLATSLPSCSQEPRVIYD